MRTALVLNRSQSKVADYVGGHSDTVLAARGLPGRRVGATLGYVISGLVFVASKVLLFPRFQVVALQ